MLIEFSVGNYRSFKEPVTLSMVGAKLKSKNKELNETNLFPINNSISLLKSAAIYGANASGKSNLIQAIKFMRRSVLESSKDSQATEPIGVENFRLSTETEGQPSYFEVIFCLDEKRYRYGFEVDAQRVHSEWLYHVPKTREANLFLREGNEFYLSNVFKEGKGLKGKTRDNALFLSVVAQFNGAISQSILRWFGEKLNVISGLSDEGYIPFTLSRMQDKTLKDDILSFVKRLDLGISDIQIEETELSEANLPKEFRQRLKRLLSERGQDEPHVVTVTTMHKKYDGHNTHVSVTSFDLDDNESEGTKKLFYLSGPLLYTLQSGEVLIIDELDSRLHPLITSATIQLFNSKVTNPKNAQLVFATHDTNLLNNKFFRRDQIWFTEKDKYGATDLYSLAEYKVRNDASFEKDYIAGRYGAIPFIGGLHYLDFLVGDNDA